MELLSEPLFSIDVVFQGCDKRGKGSLSPAELMEVLKENQMEVDQQQMKYFFDEVRSEEESESTYSEITVGK